MKKSKEPETNTVEEVAKKENKEVAETPVSTTEEPAEPAITTESPKSSNKFKDFLNWYKTHKKFSIPLTVVAILAILMTIPLTRYKVLGLVIKKDIEILAVDSKSGVQLGLYVKLDGKDAKEGYPPKFENVSVGKHRLQVESGNYLPVDKEVEIKLTKSKNQTFTVEMISTGRGLSFTINNKITGKPVEGLKIKSGLGESITDDRGLGVVFVDPLIEEAEVEVSGEGFNTLKFKHKVIADPLGNMETHSITPSGKLYFLSKKGGKIDVVKTNLDGTDRQTVLAGTGKEDDQNTVLLASRDWKYLALHSKRDSENAKLYLIDTSNDSLTTMDEGDASFVITGWSEHHFVYQVNRNKAESWQPKQQALKSYNAEQKKINTLDETNAEGVSYQNYAGETFGNIFSFGDMIVYTKNWNAGYNSQNRLNDKLASIVSVKNDGSSKNSIKTVGNDGKETSYIGFEARPYEAAGAYFKHNFSDDIFEYEDGKINVTTKIKYEDFYKFYPTYLISPSSYETFWTEPRDGKNTLLIGDGHGDGGKEIAVLSELTQYGWYTDDYLLVSKGSSELYIFGRDGLKDATQQPLKITDYHKPAYTYRDYGGGYGGF